MMTALGAGVPAAAHVPPLHPRLVQGPAVPGRRQRHPRHRPPGGGRAGRPRPAHARDRGDLRRRRARAGGHPSASPASGARTRSWGAWPEGTRCSWGCCWWRRSSPPSTSSGCSSWSFWGRRSRPRRCDHSSGPGTGPGARVGAGHVAAPGGLGAGRPGGGILGRRVPGLPAAGVARAGGGSGSCRRAGVGDGGRGGAGPGGHRAGLVGLRAPARAGRRRAAGRRRERRAAERRRPGAARPARLRRPPGGFSGVDVSPGRPRLLRWTPSMHAFSWLPSWGWRASWPGRSTPGSSTAS